MATSIECRAPLVDHQLIELLSKMPSSLKVRGFTLKYLIKKAVEPWLPAEIIRRKKRGFGAPVGSWLRNEIRPLMDELVSEHSVRKRGLFHWPAVQEILRAHDEQRRDCTDQLLALLVFEVWCRNYLDAPLENMTVGADSPAASAR